MSFKNPDRLKKKKTLVKKVTRKTPVTSKTIKVKKPDEKA